MLSATPALQGSGLIVCIPSESAVDTDGLDARQLGGRNRTRADDLVNAIESLSQVSYGPGADTMPRCQVRPRHRSPSPGQDFLTVGVVRIN